MWKIVWNWQDNNYSWDNSFRGTLQCFGTCGWLLMSAFSLDIDGDDDREMSKYIDDVDDSVGKPGIGELIKRKYKWISGRTSYWWLVHQAGITKWLNDRGINGKAVYIERTKPFIYINKLLKVSPVVLSTHKLGGLKSGHIILVVGESKIQRGYYCIDPHGDANTNYRNKNGHNVFYSKKMLKSVLGKNAKGKLRCLYYELEN